MLLNCGFGEEFLKVPWTARRSNQSILNEISSGCSLEGLMLKLKLQHAANLENSEKVSFHPNPKERHCQRMFKLPHKYTHLTHKQSKAQNSPSQASTVREP